MPNDEPALTIPLSRWASQRLDELARLTAAPAIALLTGAQLLGERAALGGFKVPQLRSAGGACRLIAAQDGWIALNLARDADRDLLAAWLEEPALNPRIERLLDQAIAKRDRAALVARGRELGLALAAVDEAPNNPAVLWQHSTPARAPSSDQRPLVVDLSALWAGPLAGHLLWLAGAQVVKVESLARPDALRQGDPALFALLNQGKDSVALDFQSNPGRAALADLIARADIVIEASRPRALVQLGIAAESLVRAKPGLVWLSLTGHGTQGQAADWVGFGDDASVAGGLSAALRDHTGLVGFGGDAVADPLTGIVGALEAWRAWQAGAGARISLAMSAVVGRAIRELTDQDRTLFGLELLTWAGASGQPFPALPTRRANGTVAGFGANTRQWVPGLPGFL